MRIFWLFAIIFMVIVFFMPLSRGFEEDQDYSEFEDEKWPKD